MKTFMTGTDHRLSLAQKRTIRGVLRISTSGSASPLPWLKQRIVGVPLPGNLSRPCVSVVE